MRIGVFDSGIGGLLVAEAIEAALPQYDYLYLGDTKRVPYGNRSQETIHEFVGQALDYLFKSDCHLIVLACNTASAEALRKSQQEYLPTHYPDRRVLGVVIPMAEAALCGAEPGARVGVIGTSSTVESNAYGRELSRLDPSAKVVQKATPLLVPLVENDGLRYADPILDDYLENLDGVESLILGCTHYAALKDQIRTKTKARVYSPDEVVPEKLADYLTRHPEHESKLSRTASRTYEVTDLTDSYLSLARRLVGTDLDLRVTRI